MRKHPCFAALALLAAAFMSCSSADKDPTVRTQTPDRANVLVMTDGSTVPYAAG